MLNNTDFIETNHAGITRIVSVSINNSISIDPSHVAKPNEPSWTLLSIPPTMTQTMHLWKFRKKHALAFSICANWSTENETGLLHPIGEMMSLAYPFCKGYISFHIENETR